MPSKARSKAHKRTPSSRIAQRFRGYLPVVVDVETSGLDCQRHAILEIAAAILDYDAQGRLVVERVYNEHLLPFTGAELDATAMKLNGITDPSHPLRFAKEEKQGLLDFLEPIKAKLKHSGCNKAIMVGHNTFFDLSFVQAACARNRIKANHFHKFSVLDTVSLGALAHGHTVLATTCQRAGINFNSKQAHSAIYDTEITAELFCRIVNRWSDLGGALPTQP